MVILLARGWFDNDKNERASSFIILLAQGWFDDDKNERASSFINGLRQHGFSVQTVFQWMDDVMLTVLEFLFISHELSRLTFRSNIKILTATQKFFIACDTLKDCYQVSAINSSTLVHVAIYR